MNPWKDHDTQFVAVVALRYCHGRQSYAPGLVCDWVKRHWKNIDPRTRGLMMRDLRGELARCRRSGSTLGADFDHRDWVAFLTWMEEHEND